MKKGQAFDTFKLMIAAVVAVAILGILLSILSGISVPNDPASMINQQLSKAYQYKGSTFVSQSEASFQSGVVYSEGSFKSSAGGVAEIAFYCDDNLQETTPNICEEVKKTVSSSYNDQLKINGDFKEKIQVCCNTGSATLSNRCHVGVGADAFTDNNILCT